MTASGSGEKLFDHTNWEILRHLQEDARLSYHELGRRVGLSAPAVAERVRRLEAEGAITGYHAQIDPAKVGLPITAFIRTTCIKNRCIHTHANPCDFPEVLEYHRVTGNNCGVFKVCASSVRHLEDLIDRLSAYELPTTSIVLSTPWVRHSIDNEHERDVEAKREGPAR
jgi:Lrp/AsnC family transcriptional regulator, leucine-responsive regulatory protein